MNAVVIQNVMLGCGVLMTVGLFFIFRSLIRQVRAEGRAEREKATAENSKA